MGELQLRKKISLFLALIMIMTVFSTVRVFAAEGMGTINSVSERKLAEGLNFRTVKSTHSSYGVQTAYVLELSNKSQVLPTVAVNSNIRSMSRMTTKIKNETQKGKYVYGGVNADFFATNTGIPLGSVIENKEVLSAGTAANAIGFKSDGSAVIGTADFNISMNIGNNSYDVDYLNKNASKWGLYLLTDRYSSTTVGDGTVGTEIVVRIDSGVMKLGETVQGTVVDVRKNTNSRIIQKNHMVLFVPNIDADINLANSTKFGDKVTLKITDQSGKWKDVTQMVGGGDILVKNGAVQSGFDSSIGGQNTRTAAGVKADGTLVLYALDKRKGISNGLTLKSVAEYLKSIGCVDAINLDGGGSTTMHVRNGNDIGIVNHPTDGAERSVTNGIILVSKATQNQLYLSMGTDTLYLASNSVFTDKVYGVRDGVKWDISDKVSYSYSGTGASASSNKISSGSGTGTGTLKASYDGKSASRSVNIVNSADSVVMLNPGVSDINLETKGKQSFHFLAFKDGRAVSASNSAFKGTVSGNVGTYNDSAGMFTAGDYYKKGSLSISALSKTFNFNITVGTKPRVIEDFEYGGSLDVNYENDGIAVTFERQRDTIKGTYSGKVSYNVKDGREHTIKLSLPNEYNITDAKQLEFQMAGKAVASFYIDTEYYGDYSFYYQEDVNSEFYNTYSMNISKNLGSCKLKNILELKVKGSGEFYIDDIRVITDGDIQNTSAPEIQLLTGLSGLKAGDVIKFKVKKPADQYEIISWNTQAFINDEPVSCLYNSYEDTFHIPLPKDLENNYGVLEIITRDRDGYHTRRNYILKGTDQNYVSSYKDTSSSWAYDYIELATNRNFLRGYDGGFYPEKNLTRYEFAQFLANYFAKTEDIVYDASEELPYEDFNEIPDWAKEAVAKMYKKGIIIGKEDDGKIYFNGNDNVTRAEVITAVGRIVDNKIFTGEVKYTDMNKIPDWALKYVAVCSDMNILKGYPEGDIRPGAYIKRSELAALSLSMCLDRFTKVNANGLFY